MARNRRCAPWRWERSCGSACASGARSGLHKGLPGGFSHDWQTDPFSRGAYSYAAVGGSSAGEELGAPLEATIFFAGEATESDGQNATVHGAIASARRVAREILRT